VIQKQYKKLNHRGTNSERWFARLLRSANILGFEIGPKLLDLYFATFVWHKERIVVQVVESINPTKNDDAALTAAGFTVFRLTHGDVQEALSVLAELLKLLTSHAKQEPMRQETKSQKRKWLEAEQITKELSEKKHSVRMLGSQETPHLRINNRVDYWPATQSFYDIRTHKKGKGASELMGFLEGLHDNAPEKKWYTGRKLPDGTVQWTLVKGSMPVLSKVTHN